MQVFFLQEKPQTEKEELDWIQSCLSVTQKRASFWHEKLQADWLIIVLELLKFQTMLAYE